MASLPTARMVTCQTLQGNFLNFSVTNSSHSASQKIPNLLWNPKIHFITVFITAHH